MDRRLTAAILAALSAGSLFLGFQVPDVSEPEPVTHDPLVAGWSGRRVPIALADAVGAVQLPLRVDEALGPHDACAVLRRGDEDLLVRDPGRSLIPASTQKLFTGLAALQVLGPDHRFVTRVFVTGRAGASVERLWLLGGGDPVLMTRDYSEFLDGRPLTRGHPVTPLDELAAEIREAGVEQVEGGIVGDASRHADALTVPTWKASYVDDQNVTNLSALTANGGFSQWEGIRLTAPDPAANAASALQGLLEDGGVEFDGEATSGAVPEGAEPIASVASPPLREVVAAMIRESDNLIAELVLREIGLAAVGEGTTAAGGEAVVTALDALGIPVEGVTMVDGSGLDRGNRATCAATLAALELRERDPFRAVDEGLAVAGETGTLYRRFEGTDLEGVLRAKTGTLAGVVGLVGLLDETPEVRFSLISNGDFGVAEGAQIQNRLSFAVDAFPYKGADPVLLSPPPAETVGGNGDSANR